jgi:ubiquinone/menaquinone biosynthesis C-methylase UbiE
MNNDSSAATPADSFTVIAPYYDRIMASVPYRFWVSYVEALWKTHGCRPRRVLDLACGTGTVALLLAAKRIGVIGTDRSAAMIDVAIEKAQAAKSKAKFIVADASTMEPIEPPVDSAICLFDSLNNILEPADLRAAIKNVRRSVADGGLFIFDMNTAYAFRQGMFNQRSSELDHPLKYLWKSKYDDATHLCTVTMEFEILDGGPEPGRKFSELHMQRAYNRVEVDDMLRDAGFDEITVYDAYTLFGPRKRRDRIFWVAR